ncbi:MFS transporter [Paramicrobacterium chengjingii]|uniref:MFS transporter n=1 Tax=Paramicrobacterium chengjingii TaxID=2769067 RepID=UPI0014238CB7|nr:MFS transporter [Microbacterium chengjingii]
MFTVNRSITAVSALLWGFQFAFLNPVLAILLAALYGASIADVGWVLAVYNAAGFVASLAIPVLADRSHNYLRPLLVCAVLSVALAGVLAFATSLPVAVIGLIVLGGPAGVGITLLFADLRHNGAAPAQVMNTRAVVSFAWVAGPPFATLIMGALGDRAILPLLAGLAALNVAITAILMVRRRVRPHVMSKTHGHRETQPVRLLTLVGIVVAFVLLQATNAATVSIMSLFVTQSIGLPLLWSGIALGTAALLEIPSLVLIGRLSRWFSNQALIVSGCIAGVLYYAALAIINDPVSLIAAQVLNAWFFGVVAGVGMTHFQHIIPRPGLATGLYMNTRRIGAIVSGAIIGIASFEPLGFTGMFLVCAVLTMIALAIAVLASRAPRGSSPTPHP